MMVWKVPHQRRATFSSYKEFKKPYSIPHYQNYRGVQSWRRQERTSSVYPYSQTHQHHDSVSDNFSGQSNVLPSVSSSPAAFYEAQRELLGLSASQLKPTNFWSLGAPGANLQNYIHDTASSLSPKANNLPPHPKEEVLALEELEQIHHSGGPLVSGIKLIVKPMTQNAEFFERCATCKEYVPGNMVSIRDHVKVHFGEKSGCMPADDLTKLLPTLQHQYCQLLMTSFPLSDHVTRNEMRNWICDICGRATTTKRGLTHHINHVHIKCTRSDCYDCTYKRKNRARTLHFETYPLDVAAEQLHPFSDCIPTQVTRKKIKQNWICDICGHATTTKIGITIHIDHVHSKCTSCICYNCTYMRKHRASLVSVCDICSRKFCTKYTLYKHFILKHTW